MKGKRKTRRDEDLTKDKTRSRLEALNAKLDKQQEAIKKILKNVESDLKDKDESTPEKTDSK